MIFVYTTPGSQSSQSHLSSVVHSEVRGGRWEGRVSVVLQCAAKEGSYQPCRVDETGDLGWCQGIHVSAYMSANTQASKEISIRKHGVILRGNMMDGVGGEGSCR